MGTTTTEIHAGSSGTRAIEWQAARVVALRDETTTARTITFELATWPGHVAGQRVDLRVTAADGYSAAREYSIASAPLADGRIDLSVERLPDGEVSPYLTRISRSAMLWSCADRSAGGLCGASTRPSRFSSLPPGPAWCR